jgi:hypothetical protein
MSVESNNVETVITELYAREVEYKSACINFADAEHAYKVDLAVEFGKAEGSVDVRKNLALIACKHRYAVYLKADAVKDYTKEMLRDAQAVLSARQSLLSASMKGDFAYATDRRTT